VAGDHPVAGIAALLVGVVAPAGLQDVELLEGTLVQQKFDALAGCELAAAVLVFDPRGAAGLKRFFFHGLEISEVALETPAGRRTGFRLLQSLRQLRFAPKSVFVFHGASSSWAIIYAEIKSAVKPFFGRAKPAPNFIASSGAGWRPHAF
jgi:hypothetical protein